MKNIVRLVLYLASLALLLAVIITCIKVEKKVMVATGSVNNVLANTATAEGTLVDIGEGVSDHGHVYSTTKDVTMSGNKIALGSKGTTGTYTSQLAGLTAGTTYYIKAYVMGSGGTELGKEISFKTADPVVPTVSTADVSAITTTTATSGGDVNSDGGAPVTAKGVCWSTTTGPTVDGNKTTDGTGPGVFTSNLTGLTDGTKYYIRAYATNSTGTGYGSEKTFTTVLAVLPTVVTSVPVNISSNSAQGGGSVTFDGGVPVLAKGFCWSKNPNPTISDPKTVDGTGTGTFGNSLSLLEPATIYHIRAYATNSKGTAYGEDLTFTTLAGMPVVATVVITGITGTGAVSGGNVTNDGGAAIITRGVCWNTTGGPTPDGPKTADGNDAGSYSSTITGLTTNTKYYVRAYATNSIGLSFGEELTFTTLGITSATITTAAITSILKTTGIGGGNITNDGGSAITSRGVCWSLNQAPTLADSHTTDDFGSGAFSSQLTGLSPGKTYYVRAYATNASGTVYGPQVSFITAADIPKVTTSAPATVTATTADPGGEVTDDNGSTVTTRGVCYNTVGTPTINDSKLDESGGIGTFKMSLTGLSPSTTYYARAFAVNGVGTAYGPQIQFTTPAAPAAISTTIITGLASASVITGGNITSDGGSAVLTRGVVWSTSSTPTIALTTKTNNGSGSGVFVSRIPDLLPGTTYNVRAYATNSVGTTFYGNEVTFTTTIQVLYNGITYNTVKIGTQLWMQDNLKTEKYRDGTNINYVTADATWQSQTAGAYCYYGNLVSNGSTYGPLYNYYATVDNKNLCPSGWHVPTDVDWTGLRTYLGGEGAAGGKLKETGIIHWSNPNDGATNESGFTALPGGVREATGLFNDMGLNGFWWSAKEYDATSALLCEMLYNTKDALFYSWNKKAGYSVRCLQGEGSVLAAVTTVAIDNINTNSARSGGNTISDGNSTILAKGVCWSTLTNPSTSDAHTNDISGAGGYISYLTGLAPNTIYYVKAYITNNVGTAYGNEISFTTSSLAIGDSYQGGKVAYILQSGDPGYIPGETHGLISALSDQSTAAEWGCFSNLISGADGTALGTGLQNTIDIIGGCATAGIAARLCRGVTINGYSDWYLPSKDELNKLYLNRTAIGGFASFNYWSSTELTNQYASSQHFTTGSQSSSPKYETYYVRAVRAF